MLNEAVLKCAALGQKNAEGDKREKTEERGRNAITLMLDFLCGWELVQTVPHSTDKKKGMILLYLMFLLSSVRLVENM